MTQLKALTSVLGSHHSVGNLMRGPLNGHRFPLLSLRRPCGGPFWQSLKWIQGEDHSVSYVETAFLFCRQRRTLSNPTGNLVHVKKVLKPSARIIFACADLQLIPGLHDSTWPGHTSVAVPFLKGPLGRHGHTWVLQSLRPLLSFCLTEGINACPCGHLILRLARINSLPLLLQDQRVYNRVCVSRDLADRTNGKWTACNFRVFTLPRKDARNKKTKTKNS